MFTVADPCIWHGCGTNLNRRQSATMVVRQPTRRAYASLHPHRPQPRYRDADHSNPRRPIDFGWGGLSWGRRGRSKRGGPSISGEGVGAR